MNIIGYLNRQSKLFFVLSGIAVNIFIGFVDYITGYDIGISVFYLVPVGFVTWFVNRKAGIYMSIISSVTISLADIFAGKYFQYYFIEFWNIFVHFSFFLIVALLMSQWKNNLESRERLILELQKALNEVKTLSGLLPICAWCKKIRDDKGYWKKVEDYIAEHSGAKFTHGMCPECFEKIKDEE